MADFDWDNYFFDSIAYSETEADRASDADADEAPEVMTSADYYADEEGKYFLAACKIGEIEEALNLRADEQDEHGNAGLPGRFTVNGKVFTSVAMQDDCSVILRGDAQTVAFPSVRDFVNASAHGSYFDWDTYFTYAG